jgi:hypothetical protein
MNDAVPLDYASLLREIKQRIRAAQLAALRQVNRELVGLYADIGRLIVSRQEGETWGKLPIWRGTCNRSFRVRPVSPPPTSGE